MPGFKTHTRLGLWISSTESPNIHSRRALLNHLRLLIRLRHCDRAAHPRPRGVLGGRPGGAAKGHRRRVLATGAPRLWPPPSQPSGRPGGGAGRGGAAALPSCRRPGLLDRAPRRRCRWPSSGTASPTPPTASTPPRPRPARAAARRYVLRKKHNSFIRIGLRMYFGCLENGLDRIGFSAL